MKTRLKPEIHNVSQRRQGRTDRATSTGNIHKSFAKIGRMFKKSFFFCMVNNDYEPQSRFCVWREMILPQCAVKWDRNLKPKLAIMRQCTSVTDRRTDRRTLTS